MNEQIKYVYVIEIESQCKFAVCAIQGINKALHERGKIENLENPSVMDFINSDLLRNIHSLLTHASNISKIFWPPMPPKKATESEEEFEERLKRKIPEAYDRLQRAKVMRELYNISESTLLKDRTLRDHLEHYDERLDHWRKNSKGKNIVGDNIGPKGMMMKIIRGIEETDMMRNFDPQTNIFHFRGEEFNIQDIADAIKEIFTHSAKVKEQLDESLLNRSQKDSLPQTPTQS